MIIPPEKGTEIYMIKNYIIEKLYSFLDSKAAGSSSDKVKIKAIDLFDSLLKSDIIKKFYYTNIYNNFPKILFL